MSSAKDDLIRESVRERYGDIARQGDSGCCGPSSGGGDTELIDLISIQNQHSSQMGYSDEELTSVPEGANMGLGCGNPQAIAALKPGETVLDLGSGAGFDSFLAARQVGEKGKIIGVDMTPDMISKARENARKGSYGNVSFRLGEIEHLPVADESVDVIISNCVINLSTAKPAVFSEAYRTLKPGGRVIVTEHLRDPATRETLVTSKKEGLVIYLRYGHRSTRLYDTPCDPLTQLISALSPFRNGNPMGHFNMDFRGISI